MEETAAVFEGPREPYTDSMCGGDCFPNTDVHNQEENARGIYSYDREKEKHACVTKVGNVCGYVARGDGPRSAGANGYLGPYRGSLGPRFVKDLIAAIH